MSDARFIDETKAGSEIWNGLPEEERRAELSHWRGAGKFADERKWQGIGLRTKKNLDRILRERRMRGFWTTPKRFLEWGQGGGANAYILREWAHVYYGVDISEKNLGETDRVLTSAGYQGFRPVLVEHQPDDVLHKVDQPVDVFLSTAVFQHFPSKEYGLYVLSLIYRLCASEAIGVIQIRFNDGSPRFSGNTNLHQYKKNYVIATTYRIEEFWLAIEKVGFRVSSAFDLNPSVNYVTFSMYKP